VVVSKKACEIQSGSQETVIMWWICVASTKELASSSLLVLFQWFTIIVISWPFYNFFILHAWPWPLIMAAWLLMCWHILSFCNLMIFLHKEPSLEIVNRHGQQFDICFTSYYNHINTHTCTHTHKYTNRCQVGHLLCELDLSTYWTHK